MRSHRDPHPSTLTQQGCWIWHPCHIWWSSVTWPCDKKEFNTKLNEDVEITLQAMSLLSPRLWKGIYWQLMTTESCVISVNSCSGSPLIWVIVLWSIYQIATHYLKNKNSHVGERCKQLAVSSMNQALNFSLSPPHHQAGPWLEFWSCPSFLKECPSKMV